MKLDTLEDNKGCFVCGRENAEGLQLEFRIRDGGQKVETTFIPPKRFQGWKDVVHGGIIMTLLDEVMAKTVYTLGKRAVTADFHARLKSPAKVMEPLRFEAEIERQVKKIIYTRAAAYKPDGTVVAEAKAKMMLI
jgi:acyl-coenzyme A thioesterase PaaI-like protein